MKHYKVNHYQNKSSIIFLSSVSDLWPILLTSSYHIKIPPLWPKDPRTPRKHIFPVWPRENTFFPVWPWENIFFPVWPRKNTFFFLCDPEKTHFISLDTCPYDAEEPRYDRPLLTPQIPVQDETLAGVAQMAQEVRPPPLPHPHLQPRQIHQVERGGHHFFNPLPPIFMWGKLTLPPQRKIL